VIPILIIAALAAGAAIVASQMSTEVASGQYGPVTRHALGYYARLWKEQTP
jgi:hypothetical protein